MNAKSSISYLVLVPIIFATSLSCNRIGTKNKLRTLLIEQTSPGQTNYYSVDLAVEYSHGFDDMRNLGMAPNPWEVKDVNNPEIISIENGTAIIDGRRLPAGVIQAHIDMIDRVEGKKKTNFVAMTAIFDDEFQMYRGIVVATKEEEAGAKIASWKKYHSFE